MLISWSSSKLVATGTENGCQKMWSDPSLGKGDLNHPVPLTWSVGDL